MDFNADLATIKVLLKRYADDNIIFLRSASTGYLISTKQQCFPDIHAEINIVILEKTFDRGLRFISSLEKSKWTHK